MFTFGRKNNHFKLFRKNQFNVTVSDRISLKFRPFSVLAPCGNLESSSIAIVWRTFINFSPLTALDVEFFPRDILGEFTLTTGAVMFIVAPADMFISPLV